MTTSFFPPQPSATPLYSLVISTKGKAWPEKKILTILLKNVLHITLTTALAKDSLPIFFKSLQGLSLEINLVLAHNPFVKSLNKKWLHKNVPTNVLSFPSFEKKGPFFVSEIEHINNTLFLGDIVLSYEKCLEETTEEKPFLNHVQHLFIHGILHLLGFDHIHDKDAEIMEALEIDILKKLSVPNPYLRDTSFLAS